MSWSGELSAVVDGRALATAFSGVVRVDRGDRDAWGDGDSRADRGGRGVRGGHDELVRAYGLADRAHEIPMTGQTQLAVASGSKGMTALVVMSLVHEGRLELSTTVRSVLRGDLPLIGSDVTIEHLLSHRSGIGDYLDDDADVGEYLMKVPVHQLATTEQFLAVLGGHQPLFAAGERFLYCNGGFVVLALVAERVSGISYHDLVRQRVCTPAGMADTDFLRSDALPGRAALGYLETGAGWRTNVFHLPVLGNGDGGIYTTVADMHRFWSAVFSGAIVPLAAVEEMLRPRSGQAGSGDPDATGGRCYGLGFWLDERNGTVSLNGHDAGVSFRSVHHRGSGLTHTVIANTEHGAWPMTYALDEHLLP